MLSKDKTKIQIEASHHVNLKMSRGVLKISKFSASFIIYGQLNISI